MRSFKALTLGHPVIMGRRTWDSLPDRFRPLPGRRNIIVTRQPGYAAPGCEVAGDLPAAIALARQSDPCPFILGGAEIYRQALPLVTLLYLTEIDAEHDGDTWFPEFDESVFTETERRSSGPLTFRTLRRI